MFSFQIPLGCEEIHHEIELGVVIGSLCKRISRDDAMKYVGGYVLALDMTGRQFQVKKSFLSISGAQPLLRGQLLYKWFETRYMSVEPKRGARLETFLSRSEKYTLTLGFAFIDVYECDAEHSTLCMDARLMDF